MSRPKKKHYGWVPDLPDHRDHLYAAPAKSVQALPPVVDLRRSMPAIYTQGRIGSCTANAIGAAIQFALKRERKRAFIPSRLFIYWNERNIECSIRVDCGAQIRTGIKVVNKLGVPSEADWPYDDTPADENTHLWPPKAIPVVKPPAKIFQDALAHQSISYQRVDRTLAQFKGVLASGFPFVFGFTVYDAFEGKEIEKTGALGLPAKGESMQGGHAVLAVGYDDPSQRFIVRNSWGTDWGLKGYFTIPYSYLLDKHLADDFWTIRTVE